MNNKWENIIPWYMTVISTFVLIAVASFLILNIEWFKEQALTSKSWDSDLFQIHIHHLHLSMIKRSVGLFAGFSALFIGMAVCFYSLKKQTQIDLKSSSISFAIATASPGIIAMIIGGYLVISTVQSKDKFSNYIPTSSKNINKTVKPTSPFSSGVKK